MALFHQRGEALVNVTRVNELRARLERTFPVHIAQAQRVFNVLARHVMLARAQPSFDENSHVLVTGRTGTGKSFLAAEVAGWFELPFVAVDATALTEAGYEGMSIGEVYAQLYRAADGDVDRARHGVVLIDEFDKLAFKNDRKDDVSCTGVQYSLLKSLDGHSFPLPQEGELAFPSRARGQRGPSRILSTRGILFIAVGAFSGLVGPVTHASIVRHGFFPELIARFPNLVHLRSLGTRELRQYLSGTEVYLQEYVALFRAHGRELRFTPRALDKLAVKAARYDFGVRALKIVLDDLMVGHLDVLYGSTIPSFAVDVSGDAFTLRADAPCRGEGPPRRSTGRRGANGRKRP